MERARSPRTMRVTICNQWGRQVPEEEALVSAGVSVTALPSPGLGFLSCTCSRGKPCCLGSGRKGRAPQLPLLPCVQTSCRTTPQGTGDRGQSSLTPPYWVTSWSLPTSVSLSARVSQTGPAPPSFSWAWAQGWPSSREPEGSLCWPTSLGTCSTAKGPVRPQPPTPLHTHRDHVMQWHVLTCATQTHPLQSSLAALHMGVCVHVHTDPGIYAVACAYRDPLVYADAVDRACAYAHISITRPAQPQSYSEPDPGPARSDCQLPAGLGCSAQATFQVPRSRLIPTWGIPASYLPFPQSSIWSPDWGSGESPSPCPLATVNGLCSWLSTQRRWMLDWVPTGNPQALKIVHKGQMELCRPACTKRKRPAREAGRGAWGPGEPGGPSSTPHPPGGRGSGEGKSRTK